MSKLAWMLFFTIAAMNLTAQSYQAPRADQAPRIDGRDRDAAWQKAPWKAMDQVMMGQTPAPEDFRGRYKAVWTPERLYILAEIVDDVLIDSHADPLDAYWEDDCFEVLIDADRSGGIHQYDYNAFAYHISLDNRDVDLGTNRKPLILNHVTSRWQRSAEQPHTIIWEVSIPVYGDDFRDSDVGNSRVKPLTLSAGMKMGLLVAYCDADSSGGRENFMGDVAIQPVNGDKNRAWIDAGVFGSLELL